MGGGMVMDPAVLIEELAALKAAGIKIEKRLLISRRAHLIMPYHKILDRLYEQAKGGAATGTTGRGIGPAFADKVSYNGLRWSDLQEGTTFEDRLRVQLDIKNRVIAALGGEPLDYDRVCGEYREYYQSIQSYVTELLPVVQKGLRDRKRFLLEQAMGTQLDPDWGTYPFVTASTTLASAATAGLGIPPRAITRVIGVTKAYTTRVGGGPLPTELGDADAVVRGLLTEVAATTGRTRRAGWFDVEPVRFAVGLSGVDALFLTRLDVLSELETLKIAVGYRLDGRRVSYASLDASQLARVEPIYRELPGWGANIQGVGRYGDLPARARRYIETIERLVGIPVRWVSTGPEREAVARK
jgi:adenylosuccinate synthase